MQANFPFVALCLPAGVSPCPPPTGPGGVLFSLPTALFGIEVGKRELAVPVGILGGVYLAQLLWVTSTPEISESGSRQPGILAPTWDHKQC